MAKIDTITPNGGEEMAYDKNKYNQQYKKDNFDRIGFYIPKGYKEKIKAYADAHGTTITEICKMALYEKVGQPEE